MTVTIIKADAQAKAFMDSGKVKERRPVSVESEVKGIAGLFFLGRVWSPDGGTTDPLSRKGFEIITMVTEGSLVHNNEALPGPVELGKGDVSVLRSASGATYTETIAPGTSTIQIWLDPDFRKSLQRPATFDTYKADEFEYEEWQGMQRIDMTGDESPLWFSTRAELDMIKLSKGDFNLEVNSGESLSGIVVSGSVKLGDDQLDMNDFFTVQESGKLECSTEGEGWLFLVRNPLQTGYKTYTDQLQLST